MRVPARRPVVAPPPKPHPVEVARRQLERATAAYEASLSQLDAYELIVQAARERHARRAFALGVAHHALAAALQDIES